MFGRELIYTDVAEVTYDNVGDVVRKAIAHHAKNANQMQLLLDFEAGNQPIKRVKKYRPDIDCHCVDNVANEITEFKLSFNWGNPITLVMREKDKEEKTDIAKGVTELNIFFDAEDYRSKQQELARYVEICGVGYTYIDVNTDYVVGESPFKVYVLSPLTTFLIVSSAYIDKRIMLGVTYSCTSTGEKRYTCFTDKERFELNGQFEHIDRSGEKNPIGIQPINEWIRSYDRMGCFERQLGELQNLNLLISDFTNDVEQNTQAIWHTNDIEFPKRIVKNEDGTETELPITLKGNSMIQTFSTADGKTPVIESLAINYDYDGMLKNIVTRRGLILQKCNVPSRNDNSGGSTGIAMSDATGWTQAEIEATRQDQIRDVCKNREVKIALKAIEKCAGFDINSPVRKLRHTDVKASIKRQKTYEMTTKINAFATGVSHGICYKDMLTAINLFDDPQQVAENSKETIEAYLASVFSGDNAPVGGAGEDAPNADRLEQDKSDQENNSPMM